MVFQAPGTLKQKSPGVRPGLFAIRWMRADQGQMRFLVMTVLFALMTLTVFM
jgi:hypothetical protein